MRKIFAVLSLALCASVNSFGQTTNDSRGQGYVFVAPSVFTSSGNARAGIHFGGGGEGLVYKGLGVGGEAGYVGPYSSLNSGLGVASVNGSYHFKNASQSGKLVPFVTGGYTLLFRSATANAVNFGGGVNYWFKERVGLRVEFRGHVPARDALSQIYGFRVGLSFR